MQIRNSNARWGAVSQLLHWAVVVLIGWMAWRGLTMVDMPPTPAKINAYALHKSLGLTLLALVALRLGWRLFAGAPEPVPGTPTWQERIASVTRVTRCSGSAGSTCRRSPGAARNLPRCRSRCTSTASGC